MQIRPIFADSVTYVPFKSILITMTKCADQSTAYTTLFISKLAYEICQLVLQFCEISLRQHKIGKY